MEMIRNLRYGGVGLAAVLAGALLLGGCESDQARSAAAAHYQLEQARRYLKEGLSDSALAAFGLALEENPRLLEAHLGMGDIYRQRGDPELAANAYERAVEAAPNSFEAHYGLGLMRQLLGQVQEAVRAYLRALALRPGDYEANQHLAAAYLQLNRPGDALPYAQKATEARSDSQGAWANYATALAALGRYDEALAAYRHAAQMSSSSDAPPEPITLGLASVHIHLGEYEKAIGALKETLREKPSVTAQERLGYCQFKLQRFDDALTSYRAAVTLDPGDPASLNGLGVSLMTMYIQGGRENPAQRDEALDAWRRSVRLRPDQPRIIDLIARYQRL